MASIHVVDGRLPRRSFGALAAVFIGLLAAGVSSTAFAFVHPMALGFADPSRARSLDVTAELHCLALNIYHEARGESLEGKFAVGQVTINRVRSRRYPNTICKVVWQRGQFSWTRDGRPDRPRNIEAWKEALQVATITYELSPQSLVGRATHYHAAYVRPSWATSYRYVRRIGQHLFYEPMPRGHS